MPVYNHKDIAIIHTTLAANSVIVGQLDRRLALKRS